MRSRQGLRRLITLTAVVGLLGMPLAQEARADDPISFTSPGNPIIADGSYYSADAAPLVVDDTLYIYAGHDEAGTQEGTFRMKDYGVYATDDVDSGDWKLYKANLTPATVFSWATGNGAYAGQTVEGDDGKFYWYVPVETKSTAYANRMAIGVAVSDSPTGPWTDALGEPLVDWGDVFGTSTSGQEIIDPHVFRDDDGSWYLYWGSWYVARAVELDTMTSWSGSISTLTGLSKFFEAPWVFKRGDTYYLAYDWKDGGSACTPSNYQACIAYATADNPLGPWSYQGIILAGTSATTVHPSIIEFDGSWYITYHTKDAVGGGHFRRSVAIDEVTWDGDKISPVTPTLANDPLKTPMSNVARNAHVSATYTETPPMRLGAVNDGRQTTALLPPDQWGNYRSTTSTVESDSVTYRFDTPVRVGSAGVQFHRDSNWIRPPASWGIEYLDASGAWKPVTATSAYPVSTTAWNEVTFQPVTTLALRATFNGQASGAYFNSVSVSEWEVNAVAPDSYVRGTATTAPGVAPVLPQAVRLKYGTETIWAPVTWLDVDPADYAAAGTFVAKGRALGYAAGLVEADVTVTTTPPVTPTDTTAPTASFALLGTQGSDGWFSSAVDATLVATDDVSYASTLEIKVGDGAWQDKGKGASAVQRITTAGNTTLSGRATDAAGNVSAVATATVKIDNVAPVGTAALDAETRATTLTASDAHSGVAKLEYRFQGGAWTAATADTPIPAPDESPTTLTWRVTDKAGNQATGTVSVPPGDPSQLSGNIAPIAAPSVSYVTGWNSTDGLNDGSGAPLGDNEDELGVAWGTWPQVGEQTATLTWDFDATLDHVGVWWLSDSPDDANAGMIPPKSWVLQYLDGGEWKDVTLASGSAYGRERDAYNRVDFSAVTTRALRIVAQSWGESSGEGSVGILEWQAFTPESVSVDETAPTLTLTSAPAAPNGAAGWYTTPVTVTATAVDDVDAAPVVESRTGAGAWAAVTGPVTLSVEGVNAVEFRAVDASGNASAAQSVEARVDTVAPAVASSVAGHTVTLTATDATSGVASVEYRVDGGAWKAYSAPVAGTAGQKIEYRATDVAGNLAKASSVTLPKDPTPKPTTEPSGPVDVYSTPGFHNVGGRWWYTACEAYSQTERCRTEIWATTAEIKDGRVVKSTGWTFNNLTYLPLMTREQWKGNPLAESGTWTSNGRQWRTECDTAATGRGGCRSYIRAEYVAASKQADGSYTYRKVTGWVFNNQVRFR